MTPLCNSLYILRLNSESFSNFNAFSIDFPPERSVSEAETEIYMGEKSIKKLHLK